MKNNSECLATTNASAESQQPTLDLVTPQAVSLLGSCAPFSPPRPPGPLPPGPRPCLPDVTPRPPTCNPACAPACMPASLPCNPRIVNPPPRPRPPS